MPKVRDRALHGVSCLCYHQDYPLHDLYLATRAEAIHLQCRIEVEAVSTRADGEQVRVSWVAMHCDHTIEAFSIQAVDQTPFLCQEDQPWLAGVRPLHWWREAAQLGWVNWQLAVYRKGDPYVAHDA